MTLAPRAESRTRVVTEKPAAPVTFTAKWHPRQKRDPRTQQPQKIAGTKTPAAPMTRAANETPGVPVTLDVRTTPMVRTKPRTRGACETLGKPGKE